MAVNTFPLHTFPLQLENAGLFRQRVCNRNITNFTMSERILNFIWEYFVRMPFFANFFSLKGKYESMDIKWRCERDGYS